MSESRLALLRGRKREADRQLQAALRELPIWAVEDAVKKFWRAEALLRSYERRQKGAA